MLPDTDYKKFESEFNKFKLDTRSNKIMALFSENDVIFNEVIENFKKHCFLV